MTHQDWPPIETRYEEVAPGAKIEAKASFGGVESG